MMTISQESLCVTDPETSTRTLAGSNNSGEDEDDRIMASTTVYVLEPGVAALGIDYTLDVAALWVQVLLQLLFYSFNKLLQN